MAGRNRFGADASARELEYVANFKGPLHLLDQRGFHADLVATHEDPEATLDLTMSAQKLRVDLSTTPNTVAGNASFFSKNGKDALFCDFHGHLTPMNAEGNQQAYVHAVFTGGQGKYAGATGTASVEADLFPARSFSQGTIRGSVLITG